MSLSAKKYTKTRRLLSNCCFSTGGFAIFMGNVTAHVVMLWKKYIKCVLLVKIVLIIIKPRNVTLGLYPFVSAKCTGSHVVERKFNCTFCQISSAVATKRHQLNDLS